MKKNMPKRIFHIVDEIIREGNFAARDESWDVADLIIDGARECAIRELHYANSRGWINDSTEERLAEYFYL